MQAIVTTPDQPSQAPVEASPEHDRQKFIGGSDVAAVLGLSPWRTPLELWREKGTPRAEYQGKRKRVLTRGQRWEAVVAEMLVESLQADGHDVQIVGGSQRYIDPELPFLAAEIDYRLIVDGRPENVELKTVHPFAAKPWGESGTDNLPVYYLAQVQHGLGVTRQPRARLAALFGADELRTYPIEADAAVIEGMRQRCTTFWTEHVLAGVPPPATMTRDLEAMFDGDAPEGTPALIADEAMTAQLLRLRAINREGLAREAERESIEFELRRAMRDATTLLLPNGKVAVQWKQRTGKYLDQAALAEAHPKLVKEFQTAWKKRVFALKPFDTEGV